VTDALTQEQLLIVESGDGPSTVIAGAGTGKTLVIVERVRFLLSHRDNLQPESLLVLTYNVKAAQELRHRLDESIGPAIRTRMTVSNFHSFCQRVLAESAADAGLPAHPDVLDGVAQTLLIKDLAPQLPLVYHAYSAGYLTGFVQFINRAKDELVDPSDFEAFVANERLAFERAYGPFEAVAARLEIQGNLEPLRKVRGAYAGLRADDRAQILGEERIRDPFELTKTADREARRTVAGTGRAQKRSDFRAHDHARIDRLAASYVIDGAALEILRLTELASVYRRYEAELARRGALDFGEQIAAVANLFKTRTNILRRWQRQFRYLLIDEFQDANVAQIELIELLGRTPDRPDNVMVVGDDDQSIYRFRGASFAAFAEFDARFSRSPVHDPNAPPPGPPRRFRIEQNFRSVGNVLVGANRLIAHNATRFEPDKELRTDGPAGDPIKLLICAGPEDEAVAIVDTIIALAGPRSVRGWGDVAILYRKHKHREAVVARLRDEDIPYTVVGGLSLFETSEIRDLEQGLRTIADPHDDVALVRMMSAGPWRLDALEILQITRMAKIERGHLLETAAGIVASGKVEVDIVEDEVGAAAEATAEIDARAGMRAKLRQLLVALDQLNPLTFREGPFTILERYLERTGQVLDLIAADTLESKRTVTNIASFLRFAADWQASNAKGTLAGFVAYLDAYKGAGGELPTSVELSEDVDGVRLMTLYQAKGLEFPIVIVPHLLDGEWPTKERGGGAFPPELLREAVPIGDIHLDEERRLLYVAMTRAQERLILTTHGGPSAAKEASGFVGEVLDGAGSEIQVVNRTLGTAPGTSRLVGTDPVEGDAIGIERQVSTVRRVMPLPTSRERRLALRLRASELVGLMEGTAATDPEVDLARGDLARELMTLTRSAASSADVARAEGLDPLTLRTVALDSGAGANLLDVAPLPRTESFSSFDTFDRCPLRYAFRYVYRMPERSDPVAAFSFGTTAHAAFEVFTREKRERLTRGDPAPTRDDLERAFRANWTPGEFGDKTTEDAYKRRVATLLDNFWTGEVSSLGQALREEEWFELPLQPSDGSAPVVIVGQIDRIDQLPSGGVEVVDYKTGGTKTQKYVDTSLQLSIYALACRDVLDLGTPERMTMYFTEAALRLSTTRTDDQLDGARDEILERVARMRSGDFAATPGDVCRWCDYRAMCPERR
jgi:DNA helicase-2/ATP-dependent DNA helicase PcrA